ncbi:MAG TPA: helix-turn-helix domain-containing protein [Solirubrobacteraceae bacterium]|nr:helix-turn-helix domain-containing protein [Solirubrobacteraceae bacterium]
MATDLLASIRSELEARMAELRPLLPEYERLLAAADALDADAAGAAAAPPSNQSAPKTTAKASPSKAKRSPRRRPGPRGSALGTIKRASKPQRGPRPAAQKAILAALEHGSHTPSELVTVTAMTSAHVRNNLASLLEARVIAKLNRDGKTAYELPTSGADA